jgi:pimeloyl-ACP methyl ester carboxylesterase
MTQVNAQTYKVPVPVPLDVTVSAFVHLKKQSAGSPKGDVVYVHGATFPSDLSVFYRFDGKSWADALNAAGFNVWGFDFVGYGHSSRYGQELTQPRGTAQEALPQLLTAVAHVRSQNGGRKVHLLAHSWGSVVAAQAAVAQPTWFERLALFGPPTVRTLQLPSTALPPARPVSIWDQYRRFIEDVPRNHPQVLLERHFEVWAKAYLATDPTSQDRVPASVMVPSGPIADLTALWQGKPLYTPQYIKLPTLLVRGEWDSVFNDADAAQLLSMLGSAVKRDIKIRKGTHLMHLEESRVELYNAVNDFFIKATP